MIALWNLLYDNLFTALVTEPVVRGGEIAGSVGQGQIKKIGNLPFSRAEIESPFV